MVEILSQLTAKSAPLIRIGGVPEITQQDLAMALAKMKSPLHSSMLLYKYTDDKESCFNLVSLFWESAKRRTRYWTPPEGEDVSYFTALAVAALIEWKGPQTACSVCSGAPIRWHRELERRYQVENPGHQDPIPCPSCFGSNRVKWTHKRRHEMIGRPGREQFRLNWSPKIDLFIQIAYDHELNAIDSFCRAFRCDR